MKKNIFLESYQELKKIKTITILAMMLAVSIILGYFTINIGGYAKLGFANIPSVIVAYLFGPITASFYGAASDIFKFILKPDGEFVIWFTLNAMFTGIMRGVILYKKNVNIIRIALCELLVLIISNWIINTYLLHMLYGKVISVILPARIIKDLVTYPIKVLIIYIIFISLSKIKNKFLK